MINESFFNTYPKLESERLIYRALLKSDAKDILSIRSNDEVMNYMDSDKHESIEKSEKFIEHGIDTYAKKLGFFWAIIEKSTGELIGDFSFWKIDHKNNRAEIGYSLKSQFWGKGYMNETINQLVKFGFEDLNLHSFEANINPENNSSRKLLLKAGFNKEAYFKENYYFDGKYLDSEIYSLVKSEN
tara:strand:- start:1600 stop:2157 length:558 start_codon:yes stop_codon:yes gene_type:complete